MPYEPGGRPRRRDKRWLFTSSSSVQGQALSPTRAELPAEQAASTGKGETGAIGPRKRAQADFGARSYDVRQGQWLSPDPILAKYMAGKPVVGVYNPSNLGLYTYAWNNPVIVKDSDGRCPECTSSALRETPGESAAVNQGLSNLAKGAWNALVSNVSDTLTGLALNNAHPRSHYAAPSEAPPACGGENIERRRYI
jgi:RHS repeat-associated protein